MVHRSVTWAVFSRSGRWLCRCNFFIRRVNLHRRSMVFLAVNSSVRKRLPSWELGVHFLSISSVNPCRLIRCCSSQMACFPLSFHHLHPILYCSHRYPCPCPYDRLPVLQHRHQGYVHPILLFLLLRRLLLLLLQRRQCELGRAEISLEVKIKHNLLHRLQRTWLHLRLV